MGQSSIYQLSAPDGQPAGGVDSLGLLVGKRIRDRRRALGMTQAELAAPMTKSYVSAVEHGRVLPSLRTLRYIAQRLGVGVGDLVDAVKPPLTHEYNGGHGVIGAHGVRASATRRRRQP